MQEGQPGKEHTPPVIIIVCDNTDIAELFFQKISGERMVDVVDDESGDGKPKRGKPKQRRVFGATELPGFAEFQNSEDYRPTLRIDSKLLAEAESEDPRKSRSDVAEELRAKVATVGKPGKAGEQVRCVVSVQMLSEGWDANNVTHILGLRAFGSQLLCEQVVGRGLRRMDYTVDPDTGLLTEEYVDVYGVPFSVIPFRGRAPNKPEPMDRPKNHVRALDERALYEIRFPVVEGYAFALERDMIKADVARIEPLHLDPGKYPTAACVKPQVGYQIGTPSQVGGFEVWEQDREAFYDTYHLQTVKFGIAQHIVTALTEGFQDPKIAPKLLAHSRQRLFPQVYRIVDEYVRDKVVNNGCRPQELALAPYMEQVVTRLTHAIEPNDAEGEPPLLPILNRYESIRSTADVDFKTTKPCYATVCSHVNQVVADTQQWEQSAAFRLDQLARDHVIKCYVKNDHLEFTIPYEFEGSKHHYTPDFIAPVRDEPLPLTLIVELKGRETEQDRQKYEAARRWCSAVNNWGRLGRWEFHVCRNRHTVGEELRALIGSIRGGAPATADEVRADIRV